MPGRKNDSHFGPCHCLGSAPATGRSFPRPRGKPGRTENDQARLRVERAESRMQGQPHHVGDGPTLTAFFPFTPLPHYFFSRKNPLLAVPELDTTF